MSSPTNKNYSRNGRRLVIFLLLLAWLTALWLVALNRQNIFDWWRLRQYKAPAAVSALASQDTMTAYGRKVFYVNRPAIDEKSAFASACPNNGGEQTIVLGCYHGGQSGIFLLNVSDSRLNGVEQVTAAHEMLHAAYDRLSDADRKKVDAMLLDYYNHGLQDQRILSTIAAYKKTEPNDLVNEMHSVFGTEITQLPSGLEQYYKRYFTDRAQVAVYAAQYQAEFTSRQAVIAQDDAQLADLKTRIDTVKADLLSKQNDISARRDKLLAQKNSGDINGYNAGVPGYNGLIDSYNTEVQTIRNLTDQYNQLVAARNAVALEENQLVKDLSNDTTPIQQ
jgi:hypothetical protein